MSEQRDDNKEHTGNPWAKTSSGDKEHVTEGGDPKREGGEERPEEQDD